jgi:hypothetical protein
MATPIDTRPYDTFEDRIEKRVAALERIVGPVVYDRCAKESSLGLVVRELHYQGKGRDVVVKVKLQPAVMLALLEAMEVRPSIQVTQSFNNDYSGSFRTHALQKKRYEAYKGGTGNRAAPPCSSWHEAGVAVDLYKGTPQEREAMKSVSFYDYLPEDPPHFSYRVDTRTNKIYRGRRR